LNRNTLDQVEFDNVPLVETRITKDKVPLLADLPHIGRLFRDVNTETETKHSLIFITPTIIDPAGNRVQVPLPIQLDQE
jgi:Flp pilus assembly secretin CpaC